MEYLVAGLIILVVILGYTTINLLLKDERKEAMIIYQQEYMDAVSKAIELCDEKLKEIDNKGHFKADDEIGWIFKNILYIQNILNQFILRNNEHKSETK